MSSSFAGRICGFSILLVTSYCAVAQEEMNSAFVTVAVSDTLGGAIPNARVQILQRSPTNEKELVTGETGNVRVEVQPGTFDLTLTSPGFLASVIRDVKVKAGEHRRINVVLKVQVSDCCIDFVDFIETVEPERAKLGGLEEPTERGATQSTKQQGCRYTQSRDGVSGYESGGPYILDHFRLTKGRTDLREFLWTHWREHKKGVAEARVGTVDRGTVNVLYVIHPDAEGQWGIDVELDRPMDPPCISFHADRLVRERVRKPKDDTSQTMGIWPEDELPTDLLTDSDVKSARTYRIILVRENKPASPDDI